MSPYICVIKQWMEAAIKSVLTSTADSINSAAREDGVPTTTLKNRLSGRVVHGTNPGPVPYLSSMEEEELVEYLSDANKIGYGKTRRQVKVIAQRVATEKGVLCSAHISHGWWRHFLQRHPQLSLHSGGQDSRHPFTFDFSRGGKKYSRCPLLKKTLIMALVI